MGANAWLAVRFPVMTAPQPKGWVSCNKTKKASDKNKHRFFIFYFMHPFASKTVSLVTKAYISLWISQCEMN